MTVISSSIVINASPAAVRAKFLDFDSLPSYHPNGFFKSIAPKNPGEPLVPGAVMINNIELGKFEAPITENSPSKFAWAGGISGLFYGKHSWQFNQGPNGPESCTLVQEEDFTGMLAFTMGESAVSNMFGMRQKTSAGFEQLNRDLKKACEQGA